MVRLILVSLLLLAGCRHEPQMSLIPLQVQSVNQAEMTQNRALRPECVESHYDFYGNYYPRQCRSAKSH